MAVWVRLHNLPIHFCDKKILAVIGNSIGRFIKIDTQRLEEIIFTFARICVEVDLSKGLLKNIKLKHKDRIWLQSLDYDDTAFRCRICRQTGHLQNACPKYKNNSHIKKKTGNHQKGWKFSYTESNEEEDNEEEELVQNESNQTETQKKSPQEPMESQSGKNVNSMEISGIKRQHSRDASNSEKENPRPEEENPLQLVPIIPSP